MRRRRRATTTSQTSGYLRVASAIMLLLLVGALYDRARDPQMWRWLEGGAQAADPVPQAVPATPAAVLETGGVLVPGPTGQDSGQRELAAQEFDVLADNSPLMPFEMFAYWRCLRWANAETFSALQSRARRDVPMTSLFEAPQSFRGELLRLRLSITRVLEFPAPENSAGVQTVYEAWGTTEESKSYPYVVVFSALPKGLKVGTDVRCRGLFVGYFVKYMAYTAFDKRRAAPLLVGRMESALSVSAPVAEPISQPGLIVGVLGGMGIAAFIAWRLRSHRRRRRTSLATALSATGDSLPTWISDAPGPLRAVWPDGGAEPVEEPGPRRDEESLTGG